MTGRPLPDEERIRDLVRNVVDGLMVADGEPGTPSTPLARQRGASPGPTPGGERSIAIGADHGGFRLKERLAFRLREQGWSVLDCGTDSSESVDYPDLAEAVSEKVAAGEVRWGIIIDGAGIGSAMVANKIPGVRASLCYDLSSARNAREHNHANVLTLGASLVGDGLAEQIVTTWLDTPWGEGRHARRVEMIMDIERRRFDSPPGGRK